MRLERLAAACALCLIGAWSHVSAETPAARFEVTTFAALEGWPGASLDVSLAAFRRSCAEIVEEGRAFRRKPAFAGTRQDWLPACEAAATAKDPRRFFEAQFAPLKVIDTIRPNDDRPNTMLWFVVDVTELGASEERLQQSEERVRQSERLDSLRTLVAGVAHDFNNLLSIVIG